MTEHMLGVFALAIIELWAAIPLGFHLKLHPVLLIAAACGGAMAGATAAICLGDGVRRLVFWRRDRKAEPGRVTRWLATKGLWAIGLLGPVLIGPLFAAALAGAIGLPRARALALLAVGIVFWTIAVTMVVTFGLTTLG